MRILPPVEATAEQLPILAENQPGVLLIRGAAGSGKTTTALMRLRQLCGTWQARRTRLQLIPPVRVLVLTYNRTLEGYVAELAKQQVTESPALHLEVRTFAKFAKDLVGDVTILEGHLAKSMVNTLGRDLGLDLDFLRDEVDYVLGRFEPTRLEDYIGARREGRGTTPRMDAPLRRRLLDEVIYPYIAQKNTFNLMDWNDVDVAARAVPSESWDVVVVDEAQDFSANQIRAIMSHVSDPHSVTFVMDTTQRIYPRSFTWREVGVTITSNHKLQHNYRNTSQIAAFARPLVEGLPIGDEGALPDFDATDVTGPLPVVVAGTYSQQIIYMIANVVETANLADESVAFLQVKGGGWFRYLEGQLDSAGIPWVQLQRTSEWPGGEETVALCTLHSAKGLEFDHVIIAGLSQEQTPHGTDEEDAQLDSLRRLIAMGVGRARKSVTLGYRPGEESTVVSFLKPGTFTEVRP